MKIRNCLQQRNKVIIIKHDSIRFFSKVKRKPQKQCSNIYKPQAAQAEQNTGKHHTSKN